MSEAIEQGKRVVVSPEGMEKLKEQLHYLENVRRPQVAEQISIARGYGDLSENAEYDAAKNEQSKLEAEIQELTMTIATAIVMDEDNITTDSVNIGTTVTVSCVDSSDADLYEVGEEISYTIVGARESDPAKGLISNDSAIGSTLLGKAIGDTVKVSLPEDQYVTFKLSSIEARK
ncbi:MAG: transcription elongation factor GreA [Clostridia bacterium]|nr:transcription elongation factor GreA [Clostridia bacterium]